MKTSRWSTAAAVPCEMPTLCDVSRVGTVVVVTLRQRNENGTYSRMRIALSAREAKRLAFNLAALSKLGVSEK